MKKFMATMTIGTYDHYAVGPFATEQEASDWADAHETGTVVAGNSIPFVSRREFATLVKQEHSDAG